MTLRVVELFAGIGAQAMALEELGIPFTSIVCENDPKAYASYCAIHGETPNLGDIRKVESIPAADLVTWSFPCLRGDMRVQTPDGPVPIRDVNVGDKVLTHMGRFRSVTGHAMTGTHGVVRIHTPISDLYCTKDHMIYTRFKIRPNGHKDENGMVRRKFTPAYWAPAISLQKENYVAYVVNTTEKLPVWEGAMVKGAQGQPKLRNELSALMDNEDFWWVCGRYVADGWTSTSQTARVIIALGKGKEQDIERIQKVFHVTPSLERTVLKCVICNTELSEFMMKRFGHGASEKFIAQDVLDMPVPLLKAFMEGYLAGDGHYNERTGEWNCNSVSEQLIRGLQQAIMKVYHAAPKYNFTKRPETATIESRTVNQMDTHSLRWHIGARKQDKMFYEDGKIWAPVKEIQSLSPTNVYDISVEEDHSFVAEGMAVHNCQDLSVASGTQKGFAEGSGTRSALAWEVIRLLKVGKAEGTLPEFLVMENVPAILNKRNIDEFKRLVKELEGIGYTSTYQVLNSKDYGVPQNRKRCFMVSTLAHGRFVFPGPCPDGRVLKDVLQPAEEIPEKLWLSEETVARYDEHWKGRQAASGGAVECVGDQGGVSSRPTMRWPAATRKGYMDAGDGDGIVMSRPTLGRGTVQPQQSPTVTCGNTTGVCLMDPTERPPSMEEGDVCAMITPGRNHKRQNGRRFKDPGEPAFTTTTTQDRHGVAGIMGGRLRIRYLSSLEAWRLQGFPDAAYNAAKAVPTSDAQLYKQAGNSIAVPCLKAIFKGMLTDGTWTDPQEKGDGE